MKRLLHKIKRSILKLKLSSKLKEQSYSIDLNSLSIDNKNIIYGIKHVLGFDETFIYRSKDNTNLIITYDKIIIHIFEKNNCIQIDYYKDIISSIVISNEEYLYILWLIKKRTHVNYIKLTTIINDKKIQQIKNITE